MKIEHLAIWTEDLDLLRRFYMKYFDAECGEMYVNNSKKFSSYFLTFGKGGTRIELMHTPDIENRPENGNLRGLAHFAISVGEKDIVDSLTKKLREDGYPVLSNPRHTGDGPIRKGTVSKLPYNKPTEKDEFHTFVLFLSKNFPMP